MVGYWVRLPNWLGDTLMARPLLHALRAAFAGAHAVAVGPAALLDLLAPERLFDARVARPAEAPASRGADLAVVCPPSFSSAWAAFRSGARQRVGFRGEWRTPLLTDAIARPARGEAHLSDEYLALGEAVSARGVPLPLLPAAPEAFAVPTVVLGPAAAYGPAKRWPEDRFVELGRRLAARGFDVRVAGAPAERALAERVAGRIGARARATAGETDLAAQARMLAGARLAVCNDSGLAHLAAALGAPTVTVFGSTSSAWTAPRGPHVVIVQRAPVCSPCFQRTCRIGYHCLVNVRVRDVERAAEPWLAA